MVTFEPLVDRGIQERTLALGVPALEIILNAAQYLYVQQAILLTHGCLKQQEPGPQAKRTARGQNLADHAAGADPRSGGQKAVFDKALVAEERVGVVADEHAVIHSTSGLSGPVAAGEDILLKQLGRRGGILPDHGIPELPRGAKMQEVAFELHDLKWPAVQALPQFPPRGRGRRSGEIVQTPRIGGQRGRHVLVQVDGLGTRLVDAAASAGGAGEVGQGFRGRHVEEQQSRVNENAVARISGAFPPHGVDGYFL